MLFLMLTQQFISTEGNYTQSKDRLLLTKPRDVLQTSKVDAQCDELATELSRKRFALKVANFQLPHLHLAPPLTFAEIFRPRKVESLWYHAVLFAQSYILLFQYNTHL